MLSQADITSRLQYVTCCLAKKSDSIINGVMTGLECSDDHIEKFGIIDAMVNAIQNYTPLEVPAYGMVSITSNGAGTILVYVNAVLIGSAVGGSTAAITATNLATAINGQGSGFIAIASSIAVIIFAPPGLGSLENGAVITYTAATMTIVAQNFIGGQDGVILANIGLNNCLTESQVNDMFEYIGNYCGLCYPPHVNQQTITQGILTNRILTQSGSRILTESLSYIDWEVATVITSSDTLEYYI